MTERKNFINQVITLPKQAIDYVVSEYKKYQAEEEYFRTGYLRDPPKDNQFSKERIIRDGDFQLSESFNWNSDSKLWQVTDRKWVQITPDPIIENKTGFIAGIVTRCQLNEQKILRQGLIDRQAFFAPPKPNEATQKSESYSEDNEIFYCYTWNQERNIWDETGRYIVIRERGIMH